MKVANYTVLLTILILAGFVADSAFARRSARQGFNFGTTLRLQNGDDRIFAKKDNEKQSHTESNQQSISPFIGYSLGPVNLGIAALVDNRETTLLEKNADGTEEIQRNTTTDTKGGSFFVRFLFGRYFFFEAGAGLYKEKTNIDSERKTLQATGDFVGKRDHYDITGVGGGYNLGGGLELNMGAGFFFTTAYNVRVLNLREHDGRLNLGRKSAFKQQRELVFGIAHYYRSR